MAEGTRTFPPQFAARCSTIGGGDAPVIQADVGRFGFPGAPLVGVRLEPTHL